MDMGINAEMDGREVGYFLTFYFNIPGPLLCGGVTFNVTSP